MVEIGTNNIDEKNYPTRHTAGQLAGGIETIVKLLREKLPDTKIIVSGASLGVMVDQTQHHRNIHHPRTAFRNCFQTGR